MGHSSVQSPTPASSSSRTLLLSPPSLSSNPSALTSLFSDLPRTTTDIQMLDRLSHSLVTLPESAYSTVLILSDADGSRTESQSLLMTNRTLLAQVVRALRPEGRLRSQDGTFPLTGSLEMREAVLAGLVVSPQEREDGESEYGMVKPNYEASQAVPLRLGQRKSNGHDGGLKGSIATQIERVETKGTVSLNGNAKGLNGAALSGTPLPKGVGYVDFSDDLDEIPAEEPTVSDSDDELIDEDTLLSDVDLSRPIIQRMLPDSAHLLVVYLITSSTNSSPLPPVEPQRPHAFPPPVPAKSAAAPAKTAPAVWPNGSKLKTEPSAPLPIKTSPSYKPRI